MGFPEEVKLWESMQRKQKLIDLICIQKSDISLRSVDQNTYTIGSCIVSAPTLRLSYTGYVNATYWAQAALTHGKTFILQNLEPTISYQPCLHWVTMSPPLAEGLEV